MAKWFALLALSLLLPAAAQPDYLISIPEGQPLGQFAHDDLTEAYRRIGLQVVFKPLPTARSIDAANQGITDAETARVGGLENAFPNLIQIPVPLFRYEIVAISKKSPLEGAGWESLKGHRICINIGDKAVEAQTAGLEKELSRSIDAEIHMLDAGRCDVMVMGQFSWLEIDRLHLGSFCLASKPLETIEMFHYVNRRHADLVPKLTDSLRSLREDGTTDAFFAPLLRQLEEAKARHACASPRNVRDAAHP